MAINIVQNVVPYWQENRIFPPQMSLVVMYQKLPVDSWWDLRWACVGQNGRKLGNWRKMGCFFPRTPLFLFGCKYPKAWNAGMEPGRCWRESTGNYCIPLYQALFGALSMYPARASLLCVFHIHCACEILSARGMTFCSLFCKMDYWGFRSLISIPQTTKSKFFPWQFQQRDQVLCGRHGSPFTQPLTTP